MRRNSPEAGRRAAVRPGDRGHGPRLIVTALAVLLLGAAGRARAGGVAGEASDRLDAPGSATDRYLSTEEIRAVLHAQNAAFFMCFRDHLPGGRDPGETSIRFQLPRDGKPTEVVAESAFGSPNLRSCLVDAVRAFTFADHDGAVLEVAYPLIWQVDTRGARVIPYPVVFTKPRPIRLPLLLLPPDTEPVQVDAVEAALAP